MVCPARGAYRSPHRSSAARPPFTIYDSRFTAIMSEALDKVRGVRELPLFPLPLVLFPGVPLPLHIFEERYQRLLADVRVSNNLFGLSYFDPGSSAEDRPAAGSACRPDRSVQG